MSETAPTNDPDILARWVGRQETAADVIDVRPARLMASLFPGMAPPAEGEPLPPLWHWLYFLEAAPLNALGRDGHPRRGGFLPPVALPRRMWAGGRLTFPRGLRIGDQAERTSTIISVAPKQGRTGPLCFVTVRHEVTVNGAVALTEEHDIVYREDPAPGAPKPAPPAAPAPTPAQATVSPSPVMLFRYSALTFNGHRIHYDRGYATETEGYGGLVFHGPLTATLLAAHAERVGGRRLAQFRFRGVSPLVDTAPFTMDADCEGNSARVWAATASGGLAMEAQGGFA
jgi:3-methylfumaryl-CoA hydratase